MQDDVYCGSACGDCGSLFELVGGQGDRKKRDFLPENAQKRKNFIIFDDNGR